MKQSIFHLHRMTHAPRAALLLLAAFTLLGSGQRALAQARVESWQLLDGTTIEAQFMQLADGQVTFRAADGAASVLPFDRLVPNSRFHVLALDDSPAPRANPPWLPGYQVRVALRVVGSLPLDAPPNTIIARVPTGGWLKKDLSDLVVTSGSGRVIPSVVLAHDPLGDTLIQFRRSGPERWYWVYLLNPNAPDKDPEQEARLAKMKEQAQTAALQKTALQKDAANKAAELRDLTAQIQQNRATADNAIKELAQWDKLLPERQQAAQAAATALPPVQEAAKAADLAHAPLQKVADEKTAAATALRREAAAAQQAGAAAGAAIEQAQTNIVTLKAAVEKAVAEVGKAQAALAKGPATAAADPKADAAAKDIAKAAREKELADLKAAVEAAKLVKTQADTAVTEATKAVPTAQAAKVAAEKLFAVKDPPAAAAEAEAQAARLAAAPTGTAKAKADQELAAATALVSSTQAAVTEATQRIAAATKLKTDAEANLAQLDPKLAPAQAAAQQSQAAAEAAVANAVATEKALFDTAAEIDPRLYKEGLSVEFREWAGDKLSSWPDVVGGLHSSQNVLGGAVVDSVLQNVNPFRRDVPRNFSASYRGYLKIDTPGIYSFFVNGDDTAFLFINGYRVYSRTGSNAPLRGRVPIYSVGADIMLEAGVHPFEMHHIIGNTPSATGIAVLAWIPPDGKAWTFVPRTAFVKALMAIPTAVEAADGGQAAVFDFAVDDALSADGMTAYVCDLQAQGTMPAPQQLQWDFGDGVTGTGARPTHVYFSDGDKVVSLQARPGVPPFRRRCRAYMPINPTNPFALGKAVTALATMDLTKLSQEHLNDAYLFLRICQEPGRFAVQEKLCRLLVARPKLDLQYRLQAYTTLMEALANQGRAEDALKMLDPGLAQFGKIRSLKAELLLCAANIERDFLKDFQLAGARYQLVIEENRRLRHPIIRQAAVAWGDMFLDAGNVAEAGKAYRLADDLGTVGLGTSDDPAKRGALLRVAEQQLKEGNVRQSQRMLRRIEAQFPEQKLEGLYRYLRGEARRSAGHYSLAIRDYEELLNLRAWAGYRPNAIFGITDSYFRMGELVKAGEWLEALRQDNPEYFEQHALAAYAERLQLRIGEAAATPPAADKPEVKSQPFQEYACAFEADEPNSPPRTPGLDVRPAMGIVGGNSAALTAVNNAAHDVIRCPLRNLPTQGYLWVEFWYRDHDSSANQGGERSIAVQCLDEQEKLVQQVNFYTERTFGRWQKAGCQVPLPATRHGAVAFDLALSTGLMEIDGIRVRHVSDAANHALQSFIEGADPQ